MRALKGLGALIDVHFVSTAAEAKASGHPRPDLGEGWAFIGVGDVAAEDPLHPGIVKLRDTYELVDPAFAGRVTVPVLWDRKADTMVNNESSEIIRMLYSEFDGLIPEALREATKGKQALFPDHLRQDIEDMNEWVYPNVNNGVYRTGFASTQEAYDAAVNPLFESLDRVEKHLKDRGSPYLFGDHITEADIRLYTTIARFDVAYHPVFLCNKKSIRNDYPAIYLWLRTLYWDKDGQARGAFYNTTQPHMHKYGPGYASARHMVVFHGQGPLIASAGPAVLIDPL